MQLSRKRTIMADHHFSSSSSNYQPQRRRPRCTIQTPDKKLLEEHRHLLLRHAHAHSSPSDQETDIEENNSTTTPLLQNHQWRRARKQSKTRSMASIFELCPMSPSPVCSPIVSNMSNACSNACSHVSNACSHVSNARRHVSNVNTDDAMFATAKSSCLVETDTKRSSSSNEIQEEITQSKLQTPNRHHLPVQNRRAERFSNQGIRHLSRQHTAREAGDPLEARTNSRQPNWSMNTVPSQPPSIGAWNQRRAERYYLADDESSMSGVQGQIGNNTLARLPGGHMEAQLKAFKEQRNFKLLTRLRKQEEAIDDWERNKILKAKEKMRQTEIKLELERKTALEKAKRDIEKVQQKAVKRKLQEQNETSKKITNSNKSVKKISCVGKLLWKLACF